MAVIVVVIEFPEPPFVEEASEEVSVELSLLEDSLELVGSPLLPSPCQTKVAS